MISVAAAMLRIRAGGKSALILSLGLLTLLSGCSIESLPSQQQPVCSWNVNPPANNLLLCARTFKTLSALVQAEVRGDDQAVQRLVVNPAVAANIIEYGRQQRSAGLIYMHVVPSLTLDITGKGAVGAGFFITGKTRRWLISDPQTVYLQVRHGVQVVVHDQPDQQW